MKFEDWDDIKYLTVKEVAAELKTDEMVIIRILLEGFLETYINKSEVMISDTVDYIREILLT